jgi:hypothetical protein
MPRGSSTHEVQIGVLGIPPNTSRSRRSLLLARAFRTQQRARRSHHPPRSTPVTTKARTTEGRRVVLAARNWCQRQLIDVPPMSSSRGTHVHGEALDQREAPASAP